MKTFKLSLVLRTRENTDVFISLDDNIYDIHSKRINILSLLLSPDILSTVTAIVDDRERPKISVIAPPCEN